MSKATMKNKLKGELLNGLEKSRERESKDTDLLTGTGMTPSVAPPSSRIPTKLLRVPL